MTTSNDEDFEGIWIEVDSRLISPPTMLPGDTYDSYVQRCNEINYDTARLNLTREQFARPLTNDDWTG